MTKKARKKDTKMKNNETSSTKREKEDNDNELDDLFAEARRKKKRKMMDEMDGETKEAPEAKSTTEIDERTGLSPPDKNYGRIKSNIKIDVDPRITNPEAPIHRWDKESGLPVYKAAALKVFTEDSGGGPDCPFDCNCCF